ncbi:MAG: holo-ACP synthase [Clostridium celatum]|jgi:holo-[acyl-carrier protein] synthase|nr:holo-ACP synthase [Clostridium celatum]MDU2121091.1 holo-ACP synthase [Clostridium celatum]MDU4978834.1 holo-ACP synthase [Clostridium celatum]
MILGIGTDIIEIERINRAINNTPMFLEKIFTKRELDELNKSTLRVESVAGNFAVKEAVSKAVGTGMRGFSFNDIEVFRDELGKPIVEVSDKVKDIIKVDNYTFNVSISHNRTCAIAFVVLESNQPT